jgi:hypothetical protein
LGEITPITKSTQGGTVAHFELLPFSNSFSNVLGRTDFLEEQVQGLDTEPANVPVERLQTTFASNQNL